MGPLYIRTPCIGCTQNGMLLLRHTCMRAHQAPPATSARSSWFVEHLRFVGLFSEQKGCRLSLWKIFLINYKMLYSRWDPMYVSPRRNFSIHNSWRTPSSPFSRHFHATKPHLVFFLFFFVHLDHRISIRQKSYSLATNTDPAKNQFTPFGGIIVAFCPLHIWFRQFSGHNNKDLDRQNFIQS